MLCLVLCLVQCLSLHLRRVCSVSQFLLELDGHLAPPGGVAVAASGYRLRWCSCTVRPVRMSVPTPMCHLRGG